MTLGTLCLKLLDEIPRPRTKTPGDSIIYKDNSQNSQNKVNS